MTVYPPSLPLPHSPHSPLARLPQPAVQRTRPRLSAALVTLACGAAVWALGACTGIPHATPWAASASPATARPTVAVLDIATPMAQRLHALGRPDVLMLGEQHDAPDHHRQHLAAVHELASVQELAAVVLEMADTGHHTVGLPTHATEPQVQKALAWRDSAWPWAHYGPAVMAAVQAGVPVWGGNLPRTRNAAVMKEADWDTRVAPEVLQAQRNAVREGHCNLLPAGQIGPMTRIQLARDAHMAQAVQAAVVPGKTVLLLTGSQHAHRLLGVPQHLPPSLSLATVRLATDGIRPGDAGGFDALWTTPALPPRDHCAELKGR